MSELFQMANILIVQKMIPNFQCLMTIILLLNITTLTNFREAASQFIRLELAIHFKNSFPLSPTHLEDKSYNRSSDPNLNWFTSPNNITLSKIITSIRNDGDHFMVQLHIGNPTQYVYLKLDTAKSPLTWVKCQLGHKKSSNQLYPVYDETKSHTYTKVPLYSSVCKYPFYRGENSKCVYNISYPKGGFVSGVASYERFQFMTRNGSKTNADQIVFGCTTDTKNIPYGRGSGILSMNKSPGSLISQLSNVVGARFSYCLALTPKVRSYLRFGNDVIKGKGKVQTTPLVHSYKYPYAYAVDMVGLNVGGFRVKNIKGTFAMSGTIFLIDTATIITSIDRGAYVRIRKVLADRFDKFRLKRTSFSKFEFCYGIRPGVELEKVLVPLTLLFRGGAVYEIPPEKAFVVNGEKSCFCLALMPTDGPNILGAMQQHNLRFTFDVKRGTVSYSQEVCGARDNS